MADTTEAAATDSHPSRGVARAPGTSRPGASPSRTFADRDAVREGLVVAAASWFAARVIVLGALALSEFIVDEFSPIRDGLPVRTTGLVGWDAAWYADIAEHGYDSLPDEAFRFFGFVPLLARTVGLVGIGEDAGLVLVANLCALAAGFLVYMLVVSEGRGVACARRAVWYVTLFPAAFVLVMGYAEATMLVLAVGGFLALRRRQWWWAAAALGLAGFTRPTGLLLVVPAIAEALPGLRATTRADRTARVFAVTAAPVGASVQLLVAQWRGGDWTLPLTEQLESDRAGSLTNPLTNVIDATRGLVDGDLVGTGLHVPWIVAFVALAILTFRFWPASYGLFAAAAVGAAVLSSNLDSTERYGLAAFPLILTLAVVTENPLAERLVLVGSAGGLAAYSTLAFLGLYVP